MRHLRSVWLAQLFLAALVLAQAGNEADKYYLARDWTNAAQAYKQLVEKEPDNARNWYRLGVALHSLHKFGEAVTAYQKSETLSATPFVQYNLACSYARLDQKDKAFEWLDKAANTSFSQLQMVESDEDLASLRTDPRFKLLTDKIARKSKPCAFSPEARQFDFWLGEWDVKNPSGQQIGTNSIQLMLGDCVIYENWTDGFGNSGKSINVYNQAKKKWQQTWVDDKGVVTEFSNGVSSDGAMRFQTERKDANGKTIMGRLTFHHLSADRVRQHMEESSDDGQTWATRYDLTYFRKGK